MQLSGGRRPADPADSEFCLQLHKAAMDDYAAAVRGWNHEDQRTCHDCGFDPGRRQIITVDGADAGVPAVEDRAREIYRERIELHPHYQGQGTGAQLLDTAARRGQDLILDVLAVNTRAYAFYERHGSREAARHGRRPGTQRTTGRSECAAPTRGPASETVRTAPKTPRDHTPSLRPPS